jgi:hypothetical protein
MSEREEALRELQRLVSGEEIILFNINFDPAKQIF